MSPSAINSDTSKASTRCQHHEVCGRVEHAEGLGYCILHDPDMEKNRNAFTRAIGKHRVMLQRRRQDAKQEEGEAYEPRRELRDDFREMVFPDAVSFEGETFPEEGVDFSGATFGSHCDFSRAIFRKPTKFVSATFGSHANFSSASFDSSTDFSHCTFGEVLSFRESTFGGQVAFYKTYFGDSADFFRAEFGESVSFVYTSFGPAPSFFGASFGDSILFFGTKFDESADFIMSRFEGRVEFSGENNSRLFDRPDKAPSIIDFRDCRFVEPEEVIFRHANLSKTSLLNVDVRRFEFTDVRWPVRNGGNGVYDEKKSSSTDLPYAALARLYRRLKQNYEDQRDYGRGGDFHFREKEMMRKNPETPLKDRILLTLYRAISGYGERFWAVGWLMGLIAVSSLVSLALGLEYTTLEGTEWTLRWRLDDFLRSVLYGMQVAFLRPPGYMMPANLWGEVVKVITMILGPLFLGLFALAVRQRVRR